MRPDLPYLRIVRREVSRSRQAERQAAFPQCPFRSRTRSSGDACHAGNSCRTCRAGDADRARGAGIPRHARHAGRTRNAGWSGDTLRTRWTRDTRRSGGTLRPRRSARSDTRHARQSRWAGRSGDTEQTRGTSWACGYLREREVNNLLDGEMYVLTCLFGGHDLGTVESPSEGLAANSRSSHGVVCSA